MDSLEQELKQTFLDVDSQFLQDMVENSQKLTATRDLG